VDINRDGVIDFQEFVQQVLQVARTQTDALSLARRTDISHAKGMAKIEKLKAVQLREMQEQQSARQVIPCDADLSTNLSLTNLSLTDLSLTDLRMSSTDWSCG